MDRTVFFHVDIDSPATLLRFWGAPETGADLERFYDTAMQRALSLFQRMGVKATFFCVGRELDTVENAGRWIARAHADGHEIANHTQTHPYGLTHLDRQAMAKELSDCSEAIRRVTGQRPVGFRAPSYDVNDQVLEILREQDFRYDSSATWNALMPLMRLSHFLLSKRHAGAEFGRGTPRTPRKPYWPLKELMELPLPRSAVLQLPFYNNFHLMAGDTYRRLSFITMRQVAVVYLIHLIEFVDLGDGVPEALAVHPNVKRPWKGKVEFLEESIRLLKRRYRNERSDRYVQAQR